MTAVELIPAGRVATYGDLARLVGTGPRQVGAIMGTADGEPWWRVVNASGQLPPRLAAEAVAHWDDEGTLHHGEMVIIRVARANLQRLEADFIEATRA